MKSFSNATAVVTGASAGIGAEFARQLAREGVTQLVLVARREERLIELKQELMRGRPELHVHTYRADLSESGEVTAFTRWITDDLKLTVDVLVNNAGLGDYGEFQSAEWEKVRTVLMVNMVALTELTHRFLPGMMQRRRGNVINISSTAGMLPIPNFAVYAATKAYVSSLSEALHVEASPFEVIVTAVCPGPVPTEFAQVANRKGSHRLFTAPEIMSVSTEDVVAESLRAALRGSARVVPGALLKPAAALLDVMPVSFLRAFFKAKTKAEAFGNRDGAAKQ